MSETFVLAHDNREAWPAIRGFAYQIDSTIIEWVKLAENQYLELELGEDIDIIIPNPNPEESETRSTVQVKCINDPISLRSAAALKAVCSYVEHLNSNPGMPLKFRFLTTAIPASEHPPEPLTCVPGIELWENIRTGVIESDERRAATNSIAAFFRAMPSPSSVRPEIWKALLDVVTYQAGFDRIVDGFQWSTGSEPAKGMEDHVQGLLVDHGFAVDTASARTQHDRLFVFLMRFLSRPKSSASRRLSCVELSSCLESVNIQPHEQRVLDEVRRTRETIIDGLADIKRDLENVKTGIGDIKGSLESGHVRRESALRAVIDNTSIKAPFELASTALLSWPRETRGKWLDRPELESLSKILHGKESSCTILLGGPGCGKSALLARIGTTLQAEHHTLLALKTDQLPRSVNSVAALDHFLQLGNSLIASIRELAVKDPIFFLIDQLDALGSLMDLHTQRLDVILKVVHALKGTKNVHVLISCRDFDFKYDVRFKTLDAQRQILADPPWETVQKLLESEGITTVGWLAEIREMMRTPQHLSFFLENFSNDPSVPIFSNYQAMLDEVFIRTHSQQIPALTRAKNGKFR